MQCSRVWLAASPWGLLGQCSQLQAEGLPPDRATAWKQCQQYASLLRQQEDTLQVQQALPAGKLQLFIGQLLLLCAAAHAAHDSGLAEHAAPHAAHCHGQSKHESSGLPWLASIRHALPVIPLLNAVLWSPGNVLHFCLAGCYSSTLDACFVSTSLPVH